jgi:hypothetical protein
MGEIPIEVVKTICSLCNSAKLESIKRVDASELGAEIENRQRQSFTGVLRLNFKEEGKLVSLYFLFLNGSIVLTMKEVVSSAGDSSFFTLPEPELRDGALEILIVEDGAMSRVAEKIPNKLAIEVEVDSSAATPEIPEEILKFKERIMADAEKAAERALEEFKPKLDMEKLRNTKLSAEKCRRVLSFIERELSEIFGEVKGKNLLKLRLTEMRFNEGEASCAEVAELINYLRKTALKNKLGKEEAEKVADRMMWRLANIAEGDGGR